MPIFRIIWVAFCFLCVANLFVCLSVKIDSAILTKLMLVYLFSFLQANRWVATGMDMLTNQQLEGCHGEDAVQKAVADIDKFVVTAKELKLSNPKEFRQLFDSVITQDTRVKD